MIAGVYDIKLSGLGFFPKRGVISIRTVDTKVSGTFDLNKRSLAFNYGTFLGERFEIEGDLALKIGKLGYTGKGTISKEGIMNLVLDTEKGRLIVTGKRRGE